MAINGQNTFVPYTGHVVVNYIIVLYHYIHPIGSMYGIFNYLQFVDIYGKL